MNKINNPEGINQYTGKAKAIVEKTKVKAGGVFASTKEKSKQGWEAVDKTVKYGAAGAAIGGAAALGGVGGARLATNAIGSGTKAAVIGGAVGAGAGFLSAKSTEKYLSPETNKNRNILRAAATVNTGALGALGGAVGYMGLKALGAPTPAKVAAGAVIGGAIGAYQGYKADRAEAGKRTADAANKSLEEKAKITGYQRQFKQV
jgi:hypothetical protein